VLVVVLASLASLPSLLLPLLLLLAACCVCCCVALGVGLSLLLLRCAVALSARVAFRGAAVLRLMGVVFQPRTLDLDLPKWELFLASVHAAVFALLFLTFTMFVSIVVRVQAHVASIVGAFAI